MSEFNISIPGGESKRLKTGGKYCPADILVAAEKSGPVVEKDVNFYDYDGQLLYSYSLAEAQALAELPPVPDWHDDLDCIGWNWTLDQIKALPSDSYGADIGALYWTKDGATHCYIEIISMYNNVVTLYFFGSVDIEWGDGNTTNGATSPISHTYTETGLYLVKLSSSTTYTLGGGTAATRFCNGNLFLKKIHMGSKGRLSAYCFSNSNHLRFITNGTNEMAKAGFEYCRNLIFYAHGNGYTQINAFDSCNSLKKISCPYQFYVQSNTFRNCSSLKRLVAGNIEFGDGHHFFGCYALRELYQFTGDFKLYQFYGNYSIVRLKNTGEYTAIRQFALYGVAIQELDLPPTLTTIEANAFSNATIRRLRFNSLVPPAVANANAFSGLSASCIVEVPAESLDTYKNATNYSTIVAQMVGV